MAARSKTWVCGHSLAGIVGSNLDGAWKYFSCKCCVLCTGLCVRLITRQEESYRMWCVWVWSWSLDNEEADDPWNKISEMYRGIHVKCSIFLSDFIETWIFSTDFWKNTPMKHFMKLRSMAAEVLHNDGRTDIHTHTHTHTHSQKWRSY